jgi:hypothetical protein
MLISGVFLSPPMLALPPGRTVERQFGLTRHFVALAAFFVQSLPRLWVKLEELAKGLETTAATKES